jgi:hypothetical protein
VNFVIHISLFINRYSDFFFFRKMLLIPLRAVSANRLMTGESGNKGRRTQLFAIFQYRAHTVSNNWLIHRLNDSCSPSNQSIASAEQIATGFYFGVGSNLRV